MKTADDNLNTTGLQCAVMEKGITAAALNYSRRHKIKSIALPFEGIIFSSVRNMGKKLVTGSTD